VRELDGHESYVYSVGFSGERELEWAKMGLQCCECSVCDLYACPEDLPPKDMCVRSKRLWQQTGQRPKPLAGRGAAHPMRDSRRIPLSRLVHRLGLNAWDVHAPMTDRQLTPAEVCIRLRQHIGVPAEPVVKEGDAVSVGQRIATIPEGKLGAHVHASIDGRVNRIDADSIWLQRSP
jgi:Na+-translocating ferredoxin:NAD+ oxidoreductase RnfC subunit